MPTIKARAILINARAFFAGVIAPSVKPATPPAFEKPARPIFRVKKSVEITSDDLPTETLLNVIKQRGDLRALLQGIASSRSIGWDNEDDDAVDHAFADQMDHLRAALRRGDLPEFLAVLDRALPHDLKGEALAILNNSQRFAPAGADRLTRSHP